jgi:hypothetical protein
MHLDITSSTLMWEGGSPWGGEVTSLSHSLYSTVKEKRALDVLLIFNPLMPVAGPTLKEFPPSPPQGPWDCTGQPCVCQLVKICEANTLVIML